MPELITHSLDEYESRAEELGRTPQTLADLRARLLRNLSNFPLFDTDRTCRHIEAAYELAWARHQESVAPGAIDVPAIR